MPCCFSLNSDQSQSCNLRNGEFTFVVTTSEIVGTWYEDNNGKKVSYFNISEFFEACLGMNGKTITSYCDDSNNHDAHCWN